MIQIYLVCLRFGDSDLGLVGVTDLKLTFSCPLITHYYMVYIVL
jgi:hypothetical protein